MENPIGSDLSKCDEAIPLLGVTREFDFGQFIELFDSTPDPSYPDDPVISRVVIQPSSTLAAERGVTPKGSRSTASSPLVAAEVEGNGKKASSPSAAPPANASPASASEVDLFDLTDYGPGAKLLPIRTEITNKAAFFATGKVDVEGRPFGVQVDEAMQEALTTGLTVTTFAVPTDGGGAAPAVPLSLTLPFERVELTQPQLADVLAGGELTTRTGDVKPVLDSGAVRALLEGRTVLTHGVASGGKMPIELHPPAAASDVADGRFEIFDLPAFVANPAVLSPSGERVALNLQAENINELLGVGRTQVNAYGQPLELDLVPDDMQATELGDFADDLTTLGGDDGVPLVKPSGTSWDEIITAIKKLKEPHFVFPFVPDLEIYYGNGSKKPDVGTGPDDSTTPSMTDKVQSRLPTGSGLPVAVFVPWKQTWTLKGFSRGNLLHSLALAPLEQVTLQIFSWERRTRSLEQSSETEVEQQTETTETTRDTEDVFREMVSKRDFAWELSGSLDASYSTGVASIQVGTEGAVSDTTSIQQTARNSSQSVRESTIKASARVRSRRVTRITQTVESGREERVTRVIQNPNQCHTLTLDFFEALAHYEIKLEFAKSRLRLVVLVPNPVNHMDFSSEIVRRSETTLRNALLEPALVDGFDACRMVAAYDEARELLLNRQADAAKIAEIDAQRDKPAAQNAPDPASPQQAEVERLAGEMITALQRIRTGADIDTAMVAIRDHDQVTEAARRAGQYWLFINFCAAKFPALLATLDELAGSTSMDKLTAAQKINAVLPRPDAPTNLGNLNQMSDGDKEQAGIASKIREKKYLGDGPWWSWWTGRMREESLYTSNDAGLGGLAEQLVKALQAWEAKKAQGAAMKDQDVAKTEAEGRQDKTTADDKLAMAFPLDELAHAYERQKVLRDHLNEHREFYNYALFQALPPSEQALRIVEASNGKLQVGLFEPRVVAMNGSRLAVPLTPLAGSQTLRDFVANLSTTLEDAFKEGLKDPDKTILPTPGLTVSSRLGKCSGCEEYIETARRYELQRLEALAKQEMWETTRREKRIDVQKNYDEFDAVPAGIKLEVENSTPSLP